jgi:2,3-bisphosphoglycerate-independent phosphoglycerate mutase
MTNYDDTFNNIYRIFDKDNITETLGEVLEKHHKKQIRIAETEKYPHVTFFSRVDKKPHLKAKPESCATRPKWPLTICSLK